MAPIAAVGEAVQEIATDNFQESVKDICVDFNKTHGRRSMARYTLNPGIPKASEVLC